MVMCEQTQLEKCRRHSVRPWPPGVWSVVDAGPTGLVIGATCHVVAAAHRNMSFGSPSIPLHSPSCDALTGRIYHVAKV